MALGQPANLCSGVENFDRYRVRWFHIVNAPRRGAVLVILPAEEHSTADAGPDEENHDSGMGEHRFVERRGGRVHPQD